MTFAIKELGQVVKAKANDLGKHEVNRHQIPT